MGEHTKGPWSVAPGDSRLSVYREGLGDIASVGNAPYWKRFDETDEANARLIAAAPDMLAALRAAEVDLKAAITICEHVYQDTAHGCRQTLEKVQAAVAKAEGRHDS